ncbi:unnamed protein product [Paramecium sonneborni]|uniref:Transmembrane protein n=1 Tax=Paramecium sonneborni TaxID=65129 RepID=A0A8S1RUI7_9CILI|nr:unnamed protein product [Paramecium sonneborni]
MQSWTMVEDIYTNTFIIRVFKLKQYLMSFILMLMMILMIILIQILVLMVIQVQKWIKLYIVDIINQMIKFRISGQICHSTLNNFELYTIVSTFANSNTNKFTIKICFGPQNNDMEVGIKNLLIYVNTCHPTCLTCDGPTETQFLSLQMEGDVSAFLINNSLKHINIGCLQECGRAYSIALYDKICVIDTRIKSKFTLFENESIPLSNLRYFPLIFKKMNVIQKIQIQFMKIVMDMILLESYSLMKE